MLVNAGRGLVVAGGLLAGAATIGVLVAVPQTRSWVQGIDDAAYDLAGDLNNRPATLVAEAFSFLGTVWFNWPLRIIVAIVLALKTRWLQLAAFALAVASSEILIGVLKSAYARERPPGSLIETTGASFPSGHAIAGAVTAVGIVVTVFPPGRRRWHWELIAVIFSTVMALSRVYLHAHWLSDTIAGALLGAALALGWPALLTAIVRRPAREPAAPVDPPLGTPP